MSSSEELKYIYKNNKCKEDIYNKNCNQFLLVSKKDSILHVKEQYK